MRQTPLKKRFFEKLADRRSVHPPVFSQERFFEGFFD